MNKKILITGGTGSIGRQLVSKILQNNPKVVRIFDVDETEQFELQHELKEYEDTVRFLLGDVRDLLLAGADFDHHRIDAAGFEYTF